MYILVICYLGKAILACMNSNKNQKPMATFIVNGTLSSYHSVEGTHFKNRKPIFYIFIYA